MRLLALFLLLAVLPLAACDSNTLRVVNCPPDSGEITVENVVVGTGGGPATASSVVVVDYEGRLGTADGEVFDSATRATLGLAGTVRGFQQGVAGMRLGGRRIITIPPSLGYRGVPQPNIPACSTLRFDVTLIDIVG
ncbi:MAG: FKBP-type peptidyl-prolyl cis-trans isomerase [Rubricoccaceae bacterium]